MKKINLGCGTDYRPGWINIDISKEVKADAYLDIQKDKLPTDNNSCDEIWASGVFEQIADNQNFVFALNECHRVLTEEGILMMVVPSSKYSITFQDPFDCRHFVEKTFDYFKKGCRCYEQYGKVYGFLPWNILSIVTTQKGLLIVQMSKYEF